MRTLLLNAFLFPCVLCAMLGCGEDELSPAPDNSDDKEAETPFSSIPNRFVGTWYAEDNEGPLDENWDQGSFQGQQGFKDFRTFIFTQDGKDAIEYTSEVVNVVDEIKMYMYRLTGTLTYDAGSSTLKFHAQAGKMRVFSNKYDGYKEVAIAQKDIQAYTTALIGAEATEYNSSANYLTAKRLDGAMELSAKYKKADGNISPGQPDDYREPPASGSYVQIGSQYYPTVAVGDLEWMSVNYAGAGGIKDYAKPQFGTFYKFIDLAGIPVPDGWRIPTKQDFKDLLASQEIELNDWESTDGSHLESKKRLGYLMSSTGWLKEDGFANNKSGFNAVPANLRVTNGNPHGEGSNCLLWTSETDDEGNPVVFKIIQLPSDTYAAFSPQVLGYNPAHIPLRLVKEKD
ncbi:MAG TPA: FISUMP domain-containing protein [Cyclobacteriaceae bacterium]|nr:FISUMP domain-containing protein [Cyclobacteriaceae bacterium]